MTRLYDLKSRAFTTARQKSDVLLAYVFLLCLVVVAGIMNPNFLTPGNFRNLFIAALPYIFVGFAQTFVILLGGIDLSVGSVVSVSNAVCAKLMFEGTLGFVPGFAAAVAVGAAVGLANGVFIVKGRLQAIVVTLATQSILAGLALAILPAPGGAVNKEFARFVTGSLKGFGFVPYVIGLVLILSMWLLLNRTHFGKCVMAAGGSEDSAYSSGINTDRVKIMVFVLCGVLSSLGGMFIAARIRAGDPLIGVNFSTNSIAVSVLGGTALSGGKGGVTGTIAGVFILMIINNILNLIGVSSYYQYIVLGLLLIAALTLSAIKTRRS